VIWSSVILADVIDAVSPSTVIVLLDAVALKPVPVIVAAAPSVQLTVIASRVGAAARLTVTSAVALAEPEVAVIVSVPLLTAVTSPADETVAMVVSDDAHVTVAPDMAVPPASSVALIGAPL
jgi:hypothetical protein